MTEEGIKTPEVAEYVSHHQIETVLTDSVNEVLRTLPPDPFSNILSIIKNYSMPIFTINSIKLQNILNKDFKEIPSLIVSMSYQGNSRIAYKYPIPFQKLETYNQLNEKNFEDLFKFFEENFEKKLINISLENLEAYDQMLKEIISNNQNDLSMTLCNAISFASFISMSYMVDKSMYTFVKELYPNYIISENVVPTLGFSLFKTGKTVNSKVKFERFILFINNNNLEEMTIYDIINKINESLKKYLLSGAKGKNAEIKYNDEGSFVPPVDALNDILKLIENVINEVNVPDTLFIGIDCNANNYYSADSKTYEMDGFKKPPDTTQLIEFYEKLIADHPLIKYLEEPIAIADEDGLDKLLEKFENDNLNISVASKYKKKPDPANKAEDINEPKEPPKLVLKNEHVKSNKSELETVSNKDPTKSEGKEDEGETENVNVSYRLGEFATFSDFMAELNFLKEIGEVTCTIWDYGYETNQSAIIDLGLGLHCDNIILNGMNLKEEKLSKIIKYIEDVKELYEEK